MKYPLSKEQNELSNQIIANFKSGIDTLVYAVCGSGKTEISYGVIAYAVVAILEYRKISKVPMEEALKNVE